MKTTAPFRYFSTLFSALAIVLMLTSCDSYYNVSASDGVYDDDAGYTASASEESDQVVEKEVYQRPSKKQDANNPFFEKKSSLAYQSYVEKRHNFSRSFCRNYTS